MPFTWREPQYIEAILKREAEQNGMPLSREGAYAYVTKKYIGFKRRSIAAWLKRIEQLQLIHKRPDANTRINKRNREGARNYRMASKFTYFKFQSSGVVTSSSLLLFCRRVVTFGWNQ